MATEKILFRWRFLTLTYRNDPHNMQITGTMLDQYYSTKDNMIFFLENYCTEYVCSPEFTDNGRIHWHVMYVPKHGSRLRRLEWLRNFKLRQGYIQDVIVKNFTKCKEYIEKDRLEMSHHFGKDIHMDKINYEGPDLA